MKKFIFIICFASCCVFASWHSWDMPPKKGQLHMIVNVTPAQRPEERQLLVVSRYRPEDPIYQYRHNGWWDVTKDDLWKWFNEGNRLMYLP